MTEKIAALGVYVLAAGFMSVAYILNTALDANATVIVWGLPFWAIGVFVGLGKVDSWFSSDEEEEDSMEVTAD